MKKTNLKWHTGSPPHVGWWHTIHYFAQRDTCWRWWDGKRWSCSFYPFDTKISITTFDLMGVKWRYYWPENARVPRINPETGEVTGAIT